jgi:hypothetical protein
MEQEKAFTIWHSSLTFSIYIGVHLRLIRLLLICT